MSEPDMPSNGLKPEQVAKEGTDQFIQEDQYFSTYATYEYFLLKHLSHFVKPGAKRLDIKSLTGYENLLAFANPDQSVVIMTQNDLGQELRFASKSATK